MSDVFRGRLTGVFRDDVAAGVGNRDPGCEARVEVTSGELAGTTIAARVVTAANYAVPWYAAMIYFFGTLRHTRGAADPVTAGRTYTVENGRERSQPVAVTIRSFRADGINVRACIEIPHDYVYHAMVMSVRAPTAGALDPAVAQGSSNRGAGVVFPGNFAWLMFIAPDGSTYGSQPDGSGRVPIGFYPAASAVGGVAEGIDVIARAAVGAQGLQPWTAVNVTAMSDMAAGYNFAGYTDYRAFWAIQCPDRPDAHIIKYRDGGGAYAVNMQPGRIVVQDPSNDEWDVADTSATNANITVWSPLQKFGVALWNNGGAAPGEGIAAICVWGRFWLNPDVVALADHTTYYIKPGTESGEFTDQQPTNSPCHRPIFRHITDGWCIIIDSEPSQHFAWAYQGVPYGPGAAPETRLAEIVFDSAPGTDTDQGVLRWRDRKHDEATDLGSGETAQEQAEKNDMMAWFVGGTGADRGFVIKRTFMIFDSGGTDVEANPLWPNIPDRPGVLAFLLDNEGRIGDEWVLNTSRGEHFFHALPRAGTHGPDGAGGVIAWKDAFSISYMNWFVHPEAGYNLSQNFQDRERRIEQFVAHEFWGRDVEYKFYNGSNWLTAFLLVNRDIPTASDFVAQSLTPGGVGTADAALPLRVREIDICDADGTVRKILVICSDMYGGG